MAAITVNARAYYIGTPGSKWGPVEVAKWRSERIKSRSYNTEVVSKLEALDGNQFEVMQYGELSYTYDNEDDVSHPLYAVKSRDWDANKPSVLVTGGIHGYETSGVQGAILFLTEGHSLRYAARGINILVAPCVSPWGYEHIQRWNPDAVDPNRSFRRGNAEACPAQEAANLQRLLASCGVEQWACHVDLHETTDTDETEFRLSKSARDGELSEPGTIPDGFYLCGDAQNPQLPFQKAVINGVRKVTHIAPADPDGTIIGSPVVDEGVILYDYETLGLCGGVTNSRLTTTTEVYPDSPMANDELCNRAQVASVTSALDYLLGIQES